MFGWFKKKVPLEVGQQWAWDVADPFLSCFIVEIVELKSGWVKAKLWAADRKVWCYPVSLPESDFRRTHKRLLTESERVGG